MTITVEKLDAYALAKASQADEHKSAGHDTKSCMICAQWSIVKQSDRIATLTLSMARDFIMQVLATGNIDRHNLARQLQVAFSLGLSAGLELAEADELAKLEALGGE